MKPRGKGSGRESSGFERQILVQKGKFEARASRFCPQEADSGLRQDRSCLNDARLWRWGRIFCLQEANFGLREADSVRGR